MNIKEMQKAKTGILQKLQAATDSVKTKDPIRHRKMLEFMSELEQDIDDYKRTRSIRICQN